ncbi:MAG: dTDP-3-amino-3,6-dideoxy-alpha-D-galactopyranose transaminase [Thermoanaerobaculia bacterium]|nr:dTDP-3-amino-3,6-dideoxy-alpha-D-galactopyranose transaminase [Thermoanaerobaculia bacterium]
MTMTIPFNDLSRAARREEPRLAEAFHGVLDRGWFILGDAVLKFEEAFAHFAAAKHAVGCANGTDAITLALRGLGIGDGDDVLTVSMTCAPTATGIVRSGARPVFVDVDDETLTMDPLRLEEALTPRTRAIVPVHLYGQPAPMPAIMEFARTHGLRVVEDCAQAHGGSLLGQPLGSFGDAASWSFYPTKNLGAIGDGGMVTTNDEEAAARMRRLRVYGYATRNDSTELGFNSRLDELQAALLLVRLSEFGERQVLRSRLAATYDAHLSDGPRTPKRIPGHVSAHHLYVIRISERDELRKRLAGRGIGTDVHYPRAVHQQPAFSAFVSQPLPVTEKAVREVLSLPLFPELLPEEVFTVAHAVRDILENWN